MIEPMSFDEMSVGQIQNKTTNQLAELGWDDDAINRFKIEREAQKVEVVALKTEANALEERLKALKERLDLVSLAPNERPKAEEAGSGKRARDLIAGCDSSDQRMVNALEERLNALKERLDLVSLAPSERPKAEEAGSGNRARDLHAGRDSFDQHIEVAGDGSDFSAGSQVVGQSMHASPRASGWIGRRISRSVARVFIAALIGAGATFAWQFHGDGAKDVVRTWVSSLGSLLSVSTTKSALNVDATAKQTRHTPTGKVSAQDAALAQPAPVPQTAPAPATAATSPKHSVEQLAAKQEQVSDNIATLKAIEPNIKQNASSPPLQNGTQLTPTPETRRTTIEGWRLREVANGTAVLEGPSGSIWRTTSGDIVPRLGRVNSIVRWGNRWIVATSRGIISMPVGQNASSFFLHHR